MSWCPVETIPIAQPFYSAFWLFLDVTSALLWVFVSAFTPHGQWVRLGWVLVSEKRGSLERRFWVLASIPVLWVWVYACLCLKTHKKGWCCRPDNPPPRC